MKTEKQIKQQNEITYDFINISHGQIINEMEVLRILNNYSIEEFSKNAGYSKNYYAELRRGAGRFSKKSYSQFMNIGLTTEKTDLEIAIEICKKAGLKILKEEIVSTWVDL